MFVGKLSSARKNAAGIGAPLKSIRSIRGNIHSNVRIHLQHLSQPRRVVCVPVRDHHEIQLRQVYAQRLHVVVKNRGIIPRVETVIRFRLCSTRAENPQSFVSSFDSPNAS